MTRLGIYLPPLGRIGLVLGAGAVSMLSLLPQQQVAGLSLFWDKAEHGLAYAVLAVLGAVGFPQKRQAWLVALGLIGLGCLLELGQGLVPGRVASWGDVLANSLGVLLAMLVFPTLRRLATRWCGAVG